MTSEFFYFACGTLVPRFDSNSQVPVINVALVLIVGLLVYLVLNGESSIHVYVMGFLAVGLMASVNW